MDKDIEHAEKALACIEKMKEGLSELVALFDIADDTFGEMDRLETYKSINRTLGRLQEKYEGVPFRGAILYLPFIGAVPATSLLGGDDSFSR